MKKRSNRGVKNWGKNELLDFPYASYDFPSSCSYRFLVCIVYATGIMDTIGSFCLMMGCSNMLDVLRELQIFNSYFPTYSAAATHQLSELTYNLLTSAGTATEGHKLKYSAKEYEVLIPYAILTLKMSFVVLLGVSIFFLILSAILFIGIYKKNSTCCFVWNVCLCMTMVIYSGLTIFVLSFNLFDLDTMQLLMVGTYGFYRFATIVAVYRFQRKFLFISQVNGKTLQWYGHAN